MNIASLPTVAERERQDLTFQVTKTGRGCFQCIVNGGINLATGSSGPALTRSLAIKVLNSCRSARGRRR